MKMNIVMVVIVFVAATLLLVDSTEATTYTVGDGLNWLEPPTPTTYTIWASSHAFVKGDVLVFNFNNGIHNVAEVTKEAYNKCNTTSPISINSKSPVSIPLPKSGKRYFISTLNKDCENGQKLAIIVLSHLPSPPPSGLPPATAPSATTGSRNVADPLAAAAPPPSSYGGRATFFTVYVAVIIGLVVQFIM